VCVRVHVCVWIVCVCVRVYVCSVQPPPNTFKHAATQYNALLHTVTHDLHLYMYVCIRRHIQIYISQSIFTCMYVYAHTHTDLCFSIHMCMYVCIRAHTHRLIFLNLYVHVCMYMRTHI